MIGAAGRLSSVESSIGGPGQEATVFEYRIAKSSTHTGLEQEINKAAAKGWEPVTVYAWNTGWTSANHAVLLRRPAPRAF